MQGDEEHRGVVAEDRLGAVPVVDVEVDDRDTGEAELGLRVARRDGDVAEDAEAHRGARERVVARAVERARSRSSRTAWMAHPAASSAAS